MEIPKVGLVKRHCTLRNVCLLINLVLKVKTLTGISEDTIIIVVLILEEIAAMKMCPRVFEICFGVTVDNLLSYQ